MSSYLIGPDRAMPCKECNEKSFVIDSRPCFRKATSENFIYRRRKCINGHRFTTYDKPEETT
jgi:transcriptional regulator NrdR family protein